MSSDDASGTVRRVDVVVVGGGPAGLSAAVTLARSRRSVLVVDAGAPRNAASDGVHGYLGREGSRPQDLLRSGREELQAYGGAVLHDEVLDAARDDDDLLRVTTAGGHLVRARRVVLATGLRDELPALEGLVQRWGRDVLHCPYCHGWEVRDQPIAILGTGPAAAHQALLFRQLSDSVRVVLQPGVEIGPEQRAQLAAWDIEIVDGPATALEVVDDELRGLRLASGDVVRAGAVVVAPRGEVDAPLLAGLEVTPVEHGSGMGAHVATTAGATDVAGVYAVGNLADPMANAVTAAATGMALGATVNMNLINEDTQQRLAEQSSVAS